MRTILTHWISGLFILTVTPAYAGAGSASESSGHLARVFGCEHLLDTARPLDHGQFRIIGRDAEGIPNMKFSGALYDRDFPVDDLLEHLGESGQFRIGWAEEGNYDGSIDFEDSVRLREIPTDEMTSDAVTARELWEKSTDSKWIVSDFFGCLPPNEIWRFTPRKILECRYRGVEVAKVDLTFKDGAKVKSDFYSDNNPDGFSLRGNPFRDLAEANHRRLEEGQEFRIWHTHPNGNPFSLKDVINLPGLFNGGVREHIKNKSWVGEFKMLVVTSIKGKLYLYEVQPSHTVMP